MFCIDFSLTFVDCATDGCKGLAFFQGDVCIKCASVPRVCPTCEITKAFQGVICSSCLMRRKQRIDELKKL